MKKLIVLIGIISISTLVGLIIYDNIKLSRLNEELQKSIGKDQGLIETILKIESESKSISYSELFDLCNKSVSERTNLIIELRGLYPEMKSELKDSLIEFFNVENELVRSKSQAYRKNLNLTSSADSYKEHILNYTYNEYSYDFHNKRSSSYIRQILESSQDMRTNIMAFENNYSTLLNKEIKIKRMMDKENLRFVSIFEKHKISNLNYIKESIEIVDLFERLYKKLDLKNK
jgi:hypothetical protein